MTWEELGLTAASLGESELAYRCLVHLVNRYWLNNLASMHNHKSLFNMDISGGMPAVIIKMLVASEPGRIQLLPALPSAWSTGTIEGVLCRGQIEIKRLHWDDGRILVTLASRKDQEFVIEARSAITDSSINGEHATIADFGQGNARKVTLSKGREVTIVLKTMRRS